jgi:hypothetical protein
MGIFTVDNTEIAVELDGLGRQHRAVSGGMVIALEQWNAGLDTGEMFADLPGGACQEAHFGYVLSGSCTVRYNDGETEKITAGEAYHLRPGHNVHIDEDTRFVEFTAADDAPGINTLEV